MLLTTIIPELSGTIPPEHLTPRVSSHSLLILFLFAGCIFIIALARYYHRNVFLHLTQGVMFLRDLDDLEREEFKSNSTSSILLLTQFFFITAGAIYWYFIKEPSTNWKELLTILFVPAIYFLYQFFMTNAAARISGNPVIVGEMNYFSMLLAQFFGLLFFFEFFVFYFQRELVQGGSGFMILTYAIYLAIRFIRGFWIGLRQGISWYYIILYFWTLEILPLLVLARLLYEEEFQQWISNF